MTHMSGFKLVFDYSCLQYPENGGENVHAVWYYISLFTHLDHATRFIYACFKYPC